MDRRFGINGKSIGDHYRGYLGPVEARQNEAMENSMKRLATLVRIHKLEIIAVTAVLVLAAFLRL